MAKTNKEEVVEKTTDEKVESPMGEKTKVNIPKKMKKLSVSDQPIKVDLKQPSKETTQDSVDKPEVKKEVKKEEKTEQPVLEEITDDVKTASTTKEKVEEIVEEVKEEIKETTPGMELPENIQKVVDFMSETGGTLEDYVRLNADYSKTDDGTLLQEYYRQTKPHLSQNERNFLIEDNFSFDEEVDEERDVKRKKLAFKEAVAEARGSLEQMKGKYYEDIKMGSKLPPAQQKAIDFFNRYNKEQEQVKKLTLTQQEHYDKKTNEVFNNKFKGFDFKVEDKKYRYNIKDVASNKEAQGNVLNVFSKYVSEDNLLQDATGYHKSLFAARNPDAIANHFYQQGKVDGIKEVTMDSKNINMDPRTSSTNTIDTGGIKYKVISGDGSSKLRFKIKN